MIVISFSFPGDTIYQPSLVTNSAISLPGNPILAVSGVLIYLMSYESATHF